MSSGAIEIIGFALSILSAVFLVPIVCGWVRDAMPSAKMRVLDALLSETEALLRSALEEGTIDYAHYDEYFHATMWQAKLHADELRAVVYNINSRWQELRAWSLGVSGRICTVMDSLMPLRGQIATSSSRGRQRLASMGCTVNPAYAKYLERDLVSSRSLPKPLASMLRSSAVVSTERSLNDAAITAPIEHALYTPVPHTPSATACTPLRGSAISEGKYETTQLSPSSNLVQTLPPLCFKSQLRATTDARRAKRIVLHRGCKPARGAVGERRRGLTGRIRAFAELFLPVTPTIPDDAALPTAPPPPYVPFDQRTHLGSAQWGAKGHVAEQIKLPA